jgi:hypothetical protein
MRTIALASFLLSNFFGICCSNEKTPNVAEAIKQSNQVFIGEIISFRAITLTDSVQIRDSANRRNLIRERGRAIINVSHYKVVVIQSFKGSTKNDTLDLYTYSDANDCGYKFELDKLYIIYSTNYRTDLLDSGVADYFPKLNNNGVWTTCDTRNRKKSNSEIERIKSAI